MLNALAIQSQVPLPSREMALAVKADLPLERVMSAETPSQDVSAEMSAEALMSAVAQNRDRKAFGRLFELFGPRVKAYLIRQGADPATAEDLVQDVMLTVWRRGAQFDEKKGAVSTWVFTIARNRRIDTLRRAKRPELDPSDPALVGEPDDPADSVVEAAQKNKLLHAAVAVLPEEQKKMLRLAYFEDKSHSVIAEELGLPLGTVKSRLRLAMAKLRTALETME